jgi:hypothetical protein
MKKNTLQLCLFILITLAGVSFKSQAQPNWTITGNANINAATNFLGTTNNKPVIFKNKWSGTNEAFRQWQIWDRGKKTGNLVACRWYNRSILILTRFGDDRRYSVI